MKLPQPTRTCTYRVQPLENIDSHKIKKHGMKLPQPTRTCTFLHNHKATPRNQQNTYATCLAEKI